jgi:glucose-1-phosphate thymidylyltransferase
MKALLLAGGFATRLWPLTEGIAKPLLIVGNKPLLSHVVDQIPSNIPIIVSTNEEFGEDFKVWQKDFHPDRAITIFIEPSNRDKQLGALGAISYAIKEFGPDDYLISAGDNIYPFAISDFIDTYKKNILVAAYDISSLEEAKKFGVISIDKKTNRAIEFKEKPKEPNSTLVSTALYIIPQDKLPNLHACAQISSENIGSFLEQAIEQKIPVDVYSFQGKWYDIGSFDTYMEVHQGYGGENKLENSNGNIYAGSVYIDPKAEIINSQIKDSIVLAGTIVKNANLNRSIIGRNCQIEDIDLEYKSVRDNTRIIGG